VVLVKVAVLGEVMPYGLIHSYQRTEEHTSPIFRVVQERSK
jgi:hypothetical protein